MNNVYNEPKYDTDTANKGYVDKKIQNLKDGVDDDIEIIDGKISYKSKNFGSQPTPPDRVNDTWMNGTDIYICINERLIGNFVASDWTKASTYDNTKSILDGGVTTNGTLVVSKGGTVAAGLTAYTSGDDGVRIWAGSDINGINSAPFRVTQGGKLYAYGATIEGGSISIKAADTSSRVEVYSDSFYTRIMPSQVKCGWVGNGEDIYSEYISFGFGIGTASLELARLPEQGTINKALQLTPDLLHILDMSNNKSTLVKAEKIETPKIVAGNMDCGTCTLNSSSDTTISFNKTFTSPPIVVLTPIVNGTAVGACYSGSVVSTTTTNFKAYCLTNLNSSGDITFNWIAIGA